MTKGKGKKRSKPRFEDDEVLGEYEKPGPRADAEGLILASAISEMKKRSKDTPFRIERKERGRVSLHFFEDGLIVDLFNRDQPPGAEMDALADDLTPEQRQRVGQMVSICAAKGLKYMHLGPDDELDKLQLAAKLGMTVYKKGDRKAKTASGDGFEEEETL